MTRIDSRGARRAVLGLVTSGAAALACAQGAAAATIHACVKPRSGATRIVKAKAKCRHGEHKLTWNTTGPRGASGKNGANGANGTPGASGAAGANGSGPLFSAAGGLQLLAAGATTLVTKVVPPGSYMVWAKTSLVAEKKERAVEELSCSVSSVPGTTGTGSPTVLDVGLADQELGEFNPGEFIAAAEVSLQAPATVTVTSTLVVSCFKLPGSTASDEATGTQLQALMVTSVG